MTGQAPAGTLLSRARPHRYLVPAEYVLVSLSASRKDWAGLPTGMVRQIAEQARRRALRRSALSDPLNSCDSEQLAVSSANTFIVERVRDGVAADALSLQLLYPLNDSALCI